MAELARLSGLSTATIKYYLREGLLARGRVTSPNQADYGTEHLHRLRLIRALIDVGGLSVAATKDVLSRVDEPDPDLDRRLGEVVGAIDRPRIDLADEDRAAARGQADALLARQGWSDVHPEYPARRSLEEVLASLTRLGVAGLLDNLDRYAELASRTAEIDLDAVLDPEGLDVDSRLERAIVMTVLGDELLATLRRVAQAAESGRRLGRAPHCP